MSTDLSEELIEEVIRFHGHLCPGLTSGIHVAEIALRELGAPAEDEEIVAVVETDSCAVDAIQYLVGCTFGKGNLIHLDHGKSVFTFARRSDGKAVRVTAKPREGRQLSPEQEALLDRVRSGQASLEDRQAYDALWRQRALAVLAEKEEDLFEIELLHDYRPPEKASIHPSVRCEACGQMTMATRVYSLNGRQLCIPCFEAAARGSVVMHPIGVVHNDLEPHQAPPRAESALATIEVYPPYREALRGIEEVERLQILFWFDKSPSGGGA